MIRAIIFDMDGLLIDSEPFWRRAEREAFSAVGLDVTESMFEETMGIRVAEVIDHWYRLRPWPNYDRDELENRIVRRMDTLIRTEGRLMTGVKFILDFFAEKRIPMAIASSSHASLITSFVESFDLRSFFKILHSAELELYGKPHPGVFLSTADKMNVAPQDCLVFEDSINGVIAARAAKMKVIAVPEPNARSKREWSIAHVVVSGLDEFSAAIWKELNV